jgi:hypothetical protein
MATDTAMETQVSNRPLRDRGIELFTIGQEYAADGAGV